MTLTIHDVPQRTPEWLELRRGIVTASVVGQLVTTKARTAIDFDCPDCGAVATEDCLHKKTGKPISTLHSSRAAVAKGSPPVLTIAGEKEMRDLAALLAAERIAGIDPDSDYVSRDMWRGITSEQFAREKYAEHYGVEVAEVGFMVRHEGDYSIGFSPDGLVGDDGGIEIKSPRRKGHLLTAVAGVVPAQHMAQIQTGLLVSGRAWWDFVSYNGGMRMWVTRVTPDPDWFLAIHAAVREFERTVQQLVTDYDAAVKGFPMTEYVDPNVVELNLS